jgi:L-arabinonolactonase
MEKNRLRVLVAGSNQLGECVLWCDRSHRVFWTDILSMTLYAHDLRSNVTSNWGMPERLASFALTRDDNRLLLGLASGLAFFDLRSAEVQPICAVEPDLPTRLNDGRCDRAGNFVFGTFCEAEPRRPIGAFYRLRADRLIVERLPLPRVAIANSICYSPDGGTMYYCDSAERAIRCCDYPSFANDRVFAQLQGQGEPDGSCIDAAGFLWNAEWGSGAIVRYAPDGSVDRRVTVPARQPSCVAFGGEGLGDLFCTSATVGLEAPAHADGALLALAFEGVAGIAESRFAGGPADSPLTRRS